MVVSIPMTVGSAGRILLSNGRIEIDPGAPPVRLVDESGVGVAVPTVPSEPASTPTIDEIVSDLGRRLCVEP